MTHTSRSPAFQESQPGSPGDSSRVPEGPLSGRRRAAPKILLAWQRSEVRAAFAPLLLRLGATVTEVTSADAYERLLASGPGFNLVLGDAQLAGSTGFAPFAELRLGGGPLPFIIVQSVHGHLLRVALGGGTIAVLSTRIVNELALEELALQLLAQPTPTQRPPTAR